MPAESPLSALGPRAATKIEVVDNKTGTLNAVLAVTEILPQDAALTSNNQTQPSTRSETPSEISPSPRIYGQHPAYDESQRPLHILVAGAGPSGIAMAIELLKLPHVTFQVFEKNHDVGGTWLENRYPGAACDVASHAYQYTFESNKNWSRHFAPAEEIGEYFKKVAQKHDIYPHVLFNTRVQAAHWDDRKAKWLAEVVGTLDQQCKSFEGDIFINAGGILNDWKWPAIQGLASFKGQTIHTARWDAAIDLTDKRVGVIGSGATSVQVVPSLQPTAKSIEVYVRSPTYILPTVGFGVESASYNEPYTSCEQKKFQDDAPYYKKFRKGIEQQMNENFLGSIKNSKAQEEGRQWAESMMKKFISSKELQDKLIPSWELGCRRITPGLPYLKAIQQENVDIIREPIDCIRAEGIMTADGTLHELDAIICATGFDTSFSARYDIIGRNLRSLKDLWHKNTPEAYFGLAISGYPNYFTLLGPNCPIANGSLIPCIEWSVKYIVKAVQKMQAEQIKSLEVKQRLQDAFNEYVQDVHQDLVWTGRCNSWYKDRATGNVVAVWPGSSIHYMETIDTPRWEDYDIQYQHSNPFKFLGNGVSQRESQKRDLAFYLDDMEG